MARTANAQIEKSFYDCFARWGRADRAAALKVLATLHEHLPPDATRTKEQPQQQSLTDPAQNAALREPEA